ncbi:hypothetical protein VUR80DRAFT_6324 [Thermomyces stellatus]
MLQEQLARRLLVRRLARSSKGTRIFAHNIYTPSSRPHPPFLSIPSKKPRTRGLSTDTKQWLKHEARLVARYSFGIWGAFFCVVVMYWSINQEILERQFPTPHEWSFSTRVCFRNASEVPHRKDATRINWVEVITVGLNAIKRLEDPEIDGAGVEELVEGSVYVDGVGRLGYDVSKKSENWRRGYYQTLMLVARAAEQLDGWMRDRTRDFVFPPDMVVGPSNPNPKPIPSHIRGAPKEEDCEVAYEPAENFYLRILTTKGFTSRQKMDAALAYAAFLDFKKLPDAAESMYKWALSLATEDQPETSVPLYDPKTFTLNEKAGKPSANLLTALTAFATHKASAGDVSIALPIFISVLKARRTLPNHPPPPPPAGPRKSLFESIVAFVQQPPYPPPPDDGTTPPWRSPQELCEEAGLSLYIGEILFATHGKEEGVAWTREAVDAAEEQLRGLADGNDADAARKTCKECLSTGLSNWSAMAARLAREEAEKKAKGEGGSGFGLWSSRPKEDAGGRWEAEEGVVRERIRRTRELLEEVKREDNPLMTLFKA